MKAIALAFAFGAVTAMAADPKEPGALVRERQAFQRDWEASTQPVLNRYSAKLEALKKSLTVAGDLQGALAVQRELDAIAAKKTSPVSVKEKLVGKRFKFHRTIPGTPTLTLARDGTIQGSDHANETSWDINPSGQLVFKRRDGRIGSVYERQTMVDGLLRFEGFVNDGKKATLRLEEIKE